MISNLTMFSFFLNMRSTITLWFYYNNEYDELVQFMLIYIPSHINLVKMKHSLKISDLLSIIIGRYVRLWYRINKSIMPFFFFLPAA